MVPWRREAMRPMRKRRRPLRAEGLGVVVEGEVGAYRVAVRKGRENSRPEKGTRKRKWSALRREGLFVW